MKRTGWLALAVAVQLTACSSIGSNAAAPAAPSDATPVGAKTEVEAPAIFDADTGVTLPPVDGVLRRRDTNVDVQKIGFDSVTMASQLTLNLFSNAQYVAVFERPEYTVSGRAWVGRVDGLSGSIVTLALGEGGSFSAMVMLPASFYSVTSGANGRYIVNEVDRSALPRP
jgi:hypothetical protein